MKRIISTLLVCVLLVGCVFSLAACGKKVSGKYQDALKVTTYEFKGSKVIITVKALGAEIGSAEGKYSIKDDKITLEFDSDDDDVKEYSGTFDFKETDDGIKIGIVEYKAK